jgi:geranylgeranylglycerol-phosphate geranylgeranyltransferase
MNAYLEILRPMNALMAVIAVVLIGIIGKTIEISTVIPIVLGIIAVFLATGAGNVINDYFDHKIDAINRPQRPIPSGRISLKNAKIYGLLLFLIAILLGLAITSITGFILPFIIVVVNSLIMYLYAHRFKKLTLIGNISVAYLTGSCFIFGGSIIGEYKISLFLSFFAFMMTLARELVKDMEDIKGDQEEKAKTFPIIYGLKKSAVLAGIFILIPTILSPILYIYKIFNLYYILILIIAIILFLIATYKILLNQETKTSHSVSKLLKIGMFVSFIAFAIGSI